MNNNRWFKPAQAVGIYVEPQQLTAVQCDCAGARRVQWRELVKTDEAVSEKQGVDSVMLDELFTRVQQQLGSSFVPVSIALADPWVRQVSLGFDALPRSERERQALVEWRLVKDWQLDPAPSLVSWQYLGEHNAQHIVVAQSLNRNLIEPLVQQAHQRKLMLINVDAAGNYLLNRLADSKDTVLLHIQPDYWSLYITGPDGWPVYRRSKWQSMPDSSQAMAVFAAQVERMIVSSAQANSQRVVLAADGVPLDQLVASLESRLGKVPELLTTPSCQAAGELQPGEKLAMQALEVA